MIILTGAKYWVYYRTGNGFYNISDNDYPRDISQKFPGLPPPTAAVYDPEEGKTYFFSGNKYWRYDEFADRFDIENEPISNRFNGVPNKLSGAFLDKNGKYLFRLGLNTVEFWDGKVVVQCLLFLYTIKVMFQLL